MMISNLLWHLLISIEDGASQRRIRFLNRYNKCIGFFMYREKGK